MMGVYFRPLSTFLLTLRARMNFAYRYVVNDKEVDDHWITLEEMLKHPDAEQFVGCLYELLAVHIGEVVTDFSSPLYSISSAMLNPRQLHVQNVLLDKRKIIRSIIGI